MLIEFSVANVLSFKDRVTFSMAASNDDALQESNVFAWGKKRLVKSAVVYGANASGKSNLLSAMRFMRHMVLTSSKDTQVNEEIDVDAFKLSTECEGKPSFFEAVFIQNGNTYRYGFEVDRKRVHSEWLFTVPSTKEAELFVREGNQIKVNRIRFKEGCDLETKTRENALFLSVCAQFNGEISKGLLLWFKNFRFIHGLSDYPYLGVTVEKLKTPEQKRQLMEIARIADLCIDDIEGREEKLTIEKLPKDMPEEMKRDILKRDITEVELKTTHRKYGQDNNEVGKVVFDLEENESGGTQKFLSMAGPLLDTIETGKVLTIDEMDARLHPLLTRFVVSLFNSPMNNKNAQLIFASHDTTLLNDKLFRRDQIWFTEKDPYGVTGLYSLVELRGVRKEASFGKDYILGKYGAIPFIGDPKWLFCEESDG
ncbi:MAG: ATP-binding protein [Proteobacteria bacterium]|nr:ATP-binding protein [Pseudomonadota bacterium]MBU1746035.1 ATP-binding protein [Pseudomonadota bacterium]MBU4371701.1 ATP-binding protein [Pseudomonadota bacterium]MBU4581891.1 ATP-binding protein [Pseudomonadota bacterium]MCG2741224.1 ATP-binding protein [Syntrophaceae bacterium]